MTRQQDQYEKVL